jgi:hypothetical protein
MTTSVPAAWATRTGHGAGRGVSDEEYTLNNLITISKLHFHSSHRRERLSKNRTRWYVPNRKMTTRKHAILIISNANL